MQIEDDSIIRGIRCDKPGRRDAAGRDGNRLDPRLRWVGGPEAVKSISHVLERRMGRRVLAQIKQVSQNLLHLRAGHPHAPDCVPRHVSAARIGGKYWRQVSAAFRRKLPFRGNAGHGPTYLALCNSDHGRVMLEPALAQAGGAGGACP